MVHGAVAGLRKALVPRPRDGATQPVTTCGGGYVLDAEPALLDMFRFEQLLSQGRELADTGPLRASNVLAEALMLWRGPAFAGLEEPFARDAAVWLDELRVDCVELRMAAELELGRHHDVVAELELLAGRQPLRERLHAQLVVALYRCGRASDALAACRRLRRTLDSELGVQPGPELRELELAVWRRSGDLELRGPVKAGAGRRSHTLPAPISSFAGRDRGLRELAGLLSEHRLVMLTGTGGSGKTRPAPGRPRVRRRPDLPVGYGRGRTPLPRPVHGRRPGRTGDSHLHRARLIRRPSGERRRLLAGLRTKASAC
jgi:DNA-binding SARP family transcriptional activator